MNFKKPEKSEFWKNEKKLLEISSFYTCVPKPQSYEVQFLRYRVRQNFFVILDHSFVLLLPHPPNNPKREMSSFSTCATKNMTIWCMLTQICSRVDIIFCHFRPFFALLHHYWPQKLKFGKIVKNAWIYYPFTHVYHKSRLHEVWFLRYKVQRTEFFVI